MIISSSIILIITEDAHEAPAGVEEGECWYVTHPAHFHPVGGVAMVMVVAMVVAVAMVVMVAMVVVVALEWLLWWK